MPKSYSYIFNTKRLTPLLLFKCLIFNYSSKIFLNNFVGKMMYVFISYTGITLSNLQDRLKYDDRRLQKGLYT